LRKDIEAVQLGLQKDLNIVQLSLQKNMDALANKLIIRLTLAMPRLLAGAASLMRVWFMPS